MDKLNKNSPGAPPSSHQDTQPFFILVGLSTLGIQQDELNIMNLLLTREEFANELRVSVRTVDRLITKGCFKVTSIGKLIRIFLHRGPKIRQTRSPTNMN